MPQGVDLDGLVRRVDPNRWLTSRFVADGERRSDLVALYAFDHELNRAETATSSPLAAQIRLAWWREAAQGAVRGSPVPHHPIAEALAATISRRALPFPAFEAMIEARSAALGKTWLEADEGLAWAKGSQGTLAGLAADVLGGEGVMAVPAGVAWGLACLIGSDRTRGAAFDLMLTETLIEARRESRRLPPTALPAALCATLARGRSRSELVKRARLTLAVLTGRV